MVGMLGLTTDLGRVYIAKNELQSFADAASIAAAALVLWVTLLVHASRKAAAMEAQVTALIAEAAGVDGRRPVASGESEPGNAWDEYAPAIEEIASNPVAPVAGLRISCSALALSWAASAAASSSS